MNVANAVVGKQPEGICYRQRIYAVTLCKKQIVYEDSLKNSQGYDVYTI